MERSKRSRRVAFFAIVAALPTALACNAIIGLDEFKRTECGIDPCPPVEGGTDVNQPDTVKPDGQTDGGTDAPPGVAPAVWAEFEMPNHSKDAGILAFDPRPLNYTTAGNVVTDNVTGLVWRNAVVGAGLGTEFNKIDDARAACTSLTDNGPWRLPKRIELVTLLSHSFDASAVYIDRGTFTGVPADIVWTSSEVRVSPATPKPPTQKYWVVDFAKGAVAQLEENSPVNGAKVLCVRDKK